LLRDRCRPRTRRDHLADRHGLLPRREARLCQGTLTEALALSPGSPSSRSGRPSSRSRCSRCGATISPGRESGSATRPPLPEFPRHSARRDPERDGRWNGPLPPRQTGGPPEAFSPASRARVEAGGQTSAASARYWLAMTLFRMGGVRDGLRRPPRIGTSTARTHRGSRCSTDIMRALVATDHTRRVMFSQGSSRSIGHFVGRRRRGGRLGEAGLLLPIGPPVAMEIVGSTPSQGVTVDGRAMRNRPGERLFEWRDLPWMFGLTGLGLKLSAALLQRLWTRRRRDFSRPTSRRSSVGGRRPRQRTPTSVTLDGWPTVLSCRIFGPTSLGLILPITAMATLGMLWSTSSGRVSWGRPGAVIATCFCSSFLSTSPGRRCSPTTFYRRRLLNLVMLLVPAGPGAAEALRRRCLGILTGVSLLAA